MRSIFARLKIQKPQIQKLVPYHWIRVILFRLPAEKSHHLSLKLLIQFFRAGFTGPSKPIIGTPVTLAGVTFPNLVGLAAGLDKNGSAIDALGSLGFGSIEVGTVTPRPQAGNPQPRMFRLQNHKAIINRLGFNNDGVEAMVERLKRRHYTGPVGVNLGKNKTTPQNKAVDDYVLSMQQVFAFCDYLTVNISSPNTKGLRDLQSRHALSEFLQALMAGYKRCQKQLACSPPLFLKVAPDLAESEVHDIAQLVQELGVSGVVVGNTTLARDKVAQHVYAQQAGGLSGAPLTELSTGMIRLFRQSLGPDIPIIGVGGVLSLADAQAKIDAGADLVQIYTGFIYEGPALVESLAKGL